MPYYPAGGGTYNLGSSIGSTDTTILLSSFLEPVSNVPYTMALLNTDIAFGTIAPRTSSSEFISFTGITQNADGSALLTGVTRGLAKKYPFTTSSTFKLPHSGQSIFILSDAPQVFNQYSVLENDETVTGIKTFSASPIVPGGATGTQAVNANQLNSTSISGAPDASTTVIGITRESVSSDVTIGTFTVTVASPAVFTASSHGLTVNDSVRFTTTGALPTGLSVGTIYYVITTGLTTNNFEVSTTRGGSAVATTGTQSGTHTLIKTTPIAVGTLDPRVPTQSENDALVGTSGTPSTSNPYVTSNDVASAATANKVARRNSTGDVTVNTTPTASTDAASKAYVDALTAYKVINSSRAQASGSGTQTISGIGFTPRQILITAVAQGAGNQPSHSSGSFDGTTQGSTGIGYDGSNPAVLQVDTSTTQIVFVKPGRASNLDQWVAVAGNIVSGAFDLVWTMTGTPGTVTLVITCFK